jgi:uncharacterized protein YchJ
VNVYLLKEAVDKNAQAGIIISIGPDELSCQAEIVAFFRRYGYVSGAPKGEIYGFYVVDKGYTREKWLNQLSESDRTEIFKAKADVEVDGFPAFHKGLVPLIHRDNVKIQVISRPQITDEIRNRCLIPGYEPRRDLKTLKEDLKRVIKDADYEAQELLANPIHAGIHPDFPATVTDEAWITTATLSLKSIGTEKWLRMVIDGLRSYFGGRPKRTVPNKNDRCACQSGKKYGKCCGKGVLEEDPEDCKLGLHEYGDWSKSPNGKYIRGCERCMKVDEAPYAEDVTLHDGTAVTLIGCHVCTQAPTIEDAQAILAKVHAWMRCAGCDQVIALKSAICTHQLKSDGTHDAKWMFTSMTTGDDMEECKYGGGKLAMLHKTCFEKVAPFREKYGTMSAVESKDGYLVNRKQ